MNNQWFNSLFDFETDTPEYSINPETFIKRTKILLSNFKDFNPKIITIAGTNGKGTTAEIISNFLLKNNYSVGKFTSPHIYDYFERIQIDNKNIDNDLFKEALNFLTPVYQDFEKHNLGMFTKYECMLTISIYAFLKSNVDIAIFEVGLGGKYDAVNSLEPDISVLTSVGLDHQGVLGNTITEIFNQKIAIARKNKPLVTSLENQNILDLLEQNKIGYDLIKANSFNCFDNKNFNINSGISFEVLKLINKSFLNTDFLEATKGLKLRGRFEILKQDPYLIYDVAHNFDSVKFLVDEIKLRNITNLQLVYVSTYGHNYKECLELLSEISKDIYIFDIENIKIVKVDELLEVSNIFFENVSIFCRESFDSSKNTLVTGSFYVLREFSSDLKSLL